MENDVQGIREQTCFFTGHRDIPRERYVDIQKKLEAAVEVLIEKGVIYYAVGGAQGFDTIAAMTILKLKAKYSQIRLIMILPCKNHNFNWQGKDLKVFEGMKERADKVVYTADRFYNGCMYKRNRQMVDGSGYCICYQSRSTGGTAYTINYALSLGVRIYNIAE